MGCVYILYMAAYLEFKQWWSVYVRFKWNYVALRNLRIIRSNTYSLDSGRLSEIGCEYDCHHKGGYWNTGYSYEQTIKYESFFVLACYIDEATLRHAHIQGRKTKKTMTFNFWYRHSWRLQVSAGVSSHVSIPHKVQFYFHVLLW